jgi:tetratricopeptide (TPR) repeat protein
VSYEPHSPSKGTTICLNKVLYIGLKKNYTFKFWNKMDAKFNQAKQLIQQEKFKKALQILVKLNRGNTSLLQPLELEAYCLFKLKQHKRAAIRWQQALNLSPNNKHIINKLVSCHAIQGNIKDAILAAEQSIKIDPTLNNANTYFQLTDLYNQQKNFEKVIEMAQKLKGISKYAYEAKLAIINSLIQLERKADAKQNLVQTLVDLVHYSKQQIGFILESLHQLGLQKELNETLTKLEALYVGDTWLSALIEQYLTSPAQQTPNDYPNSETSTLPAAVQIIGENQEVVSIIKRLVNYSQKKGGYFHPCLKIIEQDGNLSIHASVDSKQKLLSIPLENMPILTDFKFSLVGNELTCRDKKNQINPSAAPVMKMLVEIYNHTNKFEMWAKSFPFTRLQQHDALLELLFMPYSLSPTIQRYTHLLRTGAQEQLILDSFWRSRVFNFNKARLKQAGIKTKEKNVYGLLGIIDFLNHRSGENGFLTSSSTNDISIETLPDKETNEVFVQYNLEDPLKTLLIYGFVDLSSPWLFSVPVAIKLNTGREVAIYYNHSPASTDSLPEKIRHLARYLPNTIERKQNKVTLNMLTLPEKGKQKALKVMLSYCLFGKSDLKISDFQLKEVLQLQDVLIQANMDFWRKLKALIQQAKEQDEKPNDYIFTELDTLAEFGIEHIKSYLPYTSHYL